MGAPDKRPRKLRLSRANKKALAGQGLGYRTENDLRIRSRGRRISRRLNGGLAGCHSYDRSDGNSDGYCRPAGGSSKDERPHGSAWVCPAGYYLASDGWCYNYF